MLQPTMGMQYQSYAILPKCIISRTDCSPTCKLVYAILLDRVQLSLAHDNYVDDIGPYIIYPVEALCADTGVCRSVISRTLGQLTKLGLIRKKRSGYSKPYKIYVYVPTDAVMLSSINDDKYHNDTSICVTDIPIDVSDVYPNNTDIINTKDNTIILGCDHNIYLTQEQLDDLAVKYPINYARKIDEMSLYISSSGKQYAGHYATLLLWLNREQKSQNIGIKYEF